MNLIEKLFEFKNLPDKNTPFNTKNLNQMQKQLLDVVYPIGRGFIDFTNTDYSDYLGFTWERELVGMTAIGLDVNQSEFNTVGKTGGSKSNTYNFQHNHSTGNHTLTVNQIPAHSHGLSSGTDFRVGGVKSRGVSRSSIASGSDGFAFVTDSKTSNSGLGFSNISNTGGGQAHNHGNTGNALSNTSISTIQPYKVVSYWKRVA